MKCHAILTAALLNMGLAMPLVTTLSAPAAAQSASTQTTALRTTVFAIQNMTCALCPVTVKTAMEGVSGVQSVTVDFDAKTATVIYDPAVATVDAICAASTNAGYPASPKG